jgi:uncharacterized protein with PIN domain
MFDKPKFIADFMLGRLARWLRVLGYDTLYAIRQKRSDMQLQSLKESRVILTRDSRLSAKRSYGLLLIKDDLYLGQLKQVFKTFDLKIDRNNIFKICSVCNSRLAEVGKKEEVKGLVPEYVYETHDDFTVCPVCQKIYWKGTHSELIDKILIELEER